MKLLSLLLASAVLATQAEQPFLMVPQSRNPTGKRLYTKEQWLPSRTAMIVCDMWDLHPCRNAALREAEIAPRMNQVLEKARSMGVLIIHAPSACMKAYEGTPARQRAIDAPKAFNLPPNIGEWCKQIPAEEFAVYPLDQSDGGVDEDAATHDAWIKEIIAKGANPKAPWTRQIDVLRIDQERDAISDSGIEVWNLLESRRIDHVILMGVHTNMCVSGRPFGLRQMVQNGKRTVLIRDLTDTMYNPKRWPFVSHQRGTELYIEHVEQHICPTISSDQFLGGDPLVLSDATAGPSRAQIVLLGDSTTEESIPRKVVPEEPRFEDTLRILLGQDTTLPHTDVHNLALSGDYIQRYLESGRYDSTVPKLARADFIFIRYGINDRSKLKDFDTEFPKHYAELVARLRRDHPQAQIIAMATIPYGAEGQHLPVNAKIKSVAKSLGLAYFDIAPRFLAELAKGPNMLNYRRFSLAKVPEELRPLATPYIEQGKEPQIVVMDNRLDAHFGHLPGWFSDRHPNQAGYHVIADETAKWLAPKLREWAKKPAAATLPSPTR